MNYLSTLQLVYRVARRHAELGPGFAQQSSVLRAAAEEAGVRRGDVDSQQLLLTCWHDLFRFGKLAWGYNLDNPDAPFFHVPVVDHTRIDHAGVLDLNLQA